MGKLKVLDLFSGIGGFSLGLERTGGFETVAFCEIDPFCQKVLKKHWPDVPIFNDVRTLNYDGAVDVITGGYPCQPFSTAGRRKGENDDRHLWPAMFSLIQKHRPAWVIGENVAGHVTMGLDRVLSDLGGALYAARTFIIPAVAVDARHRRDRTWIIANAVNERCDNGGDYWQERHIQNDLYGDAPQGEQERQGWECGAGSPGADVAHTGRKPDEPERASGERSCTAAKVQGEARKQRLRSETANGSKNVSYAASLGQSGQGQPLIGGGSTPDGEGEAGKPFPIREYREWAAEPPLGRVANGVSNRVDRLKSLGNAVVPHLPEIIGHAILAAEAA